MKLLTTALMIAALALPAAAVARDDHRGGQGRADQGHGGAPARGAPGPAGPAAGYRYAPPSGGGYAPYGLAPSAPPYRGRPAYPPAGYGGPGGYGVPRARVPGDWNDYPPAGGPARWRRGQFFPPAYRGEIVADYYRYHLRRPPPGYYWYRNGDDFILAAVTSGLIFEVVAGEGY